MAPKMVQVSSSITKFVQESSKIAKPRQTRQAQRPLAWPYLALIRFHFQVNSYHVLLKVRLLTKLLITPSALVILLLPVNSCHVSLKVRL